MNIMKMNLIVKIHTDIDISCPTMMPPEYFMEVYRYAKSHIFNVEQEAKAAVTYTVFIYILQDTQQQRPEFIFHLYKNEYMYTQKVSYLQC